jgi:alpha-1,2-mannosyltransferase
MLIGSCRGDQDRARVLSLRELSVTLGIADHVEFMVGIPNQELHSLLGAAKAGLHTMWCEHFGIGVVEFQVCHMTEVERERECVCADVVCVCVCVCVCGWVGVGACGCECVWVRAGVSACVYMSE